jgi:Tfp pilus assembly protein PilW
MRHFITNIIKQNGFSQIEIIASLALAGLLTTGVTAFVFHTINVTVNTQNRMQAIMQVENAGYWMSRDIQMSDNFTLGENAGFPMQLAWKDIDQNEYEVTYSLNQTSIIRSLIKNEESPIHNLIAQDINASASLTNLNSIDGLLVLNITSTSEDIDVSRTYKIKPRLDFES